MTDHKATSMDAVGELPVEMFEPAQPAALPVHRDYRVTETVSEQPVQPAAQEPEWVDDPHDIEQGMIRNPKWKPSTAIAQPVEPVVCPNCIGQCWESSVYDGPIPCSRCTTLAQPVQPAITDEQVRRMSERHQAEALEEWAQPVQPAAQWMPIETAPTDGTHFLAWYPKVSLNGDGNISEELQGGVIAMISIKWDSWDQPDWINEHGASEWRLSQEPTHCMPLPPPPATANSSKQEKQND